MKLFVGLEMYSATLYVFLYGVNYSSESGSTCAKSKQDCSVLERCTEDN